MINEIKNYENSFLAEYFKTKQTKYYEGVNLTKEEREIDRRNYLSTYYGRLFIEKEKLIFSGTGIDFGICMADISFTEQYKNGIIIYTGVKEYAFVCDDALKIYNLIENLKH